MDLKTIVDLNFVCNYVIHNMYLVVTLNLNVTQTLFQTAEFILVALIHRYSFREYNPERFRDSTIKLSDKSNHAF